MPAAPDHYRFALSRLSAAAAAGGPLAALVRAPALVLLGTQGPDPFYFRGMLPPNPRARRRTLAAADFLHGADPAAVFPRLASRAAALSGAEREAAASFTYGLLLHYALDRALHPYVYYRTGFDAAGQTSGPFGVDHGRFETGMAESARGGQAPELTSPRVLFAAGRAELGFADAFLAGTFPERLRRGDYAASWRQMRMVLGLLWDPSGRRRRFLDAAGLGDSRPRSMIRPLLEPGADGIDYLNEGGAEWLHPSEGTRFDLSVPELVVRAADDGDRALELLSEALDGKDADWNGFFGGVNHEGNRPGRAMRLYRSLYRTSPS